MKTSIGLALALAGALIWSGFAVGPTLLGVGLGLILDSAIWGGE